MPLTSIAEQFQVLVTELEKHPTQTGSIGGPACAMAHVQSIVLTPRIVEHCEQAYHLLDGPTALRD
jgi:hypothetical protein